MRFWTSDTHFGHANVMGYCNRPFKDVWHMNEVLKAKWNESVGTSDEVWFVGDFSMNQGFLRILNELNFGHLFWILGNHDKETRIKRELEGGSLYNLSSKIHLIREAEITIEGQQFKVIHRPMDCSDDIPSIVGHVHERWTFLPAGSLIKEHSRRTNGIIEKIIKQPILNVGVDVHNFKPISDEEVFKYFKTGEKV